MASTPSTSLMRSAMVAENGSPKALLTTKSPTKFSSTAWSTDAFDEAPRIATVNASASPIISAEAVAAVRRGLRSEFWPARLPTGPKTRRFAAAASLRNGRLIERRGRRDAEQDPEDAGADPPARVRHVEEQPERQRDRSETMTTSTEQEPSPERGLGQGDVVAQRLHRGDPAAAPGRQPGRRHRDERRPMAYAASTVRGARIRSCALMSRPTRAIRLRIAIARPMPRPTPSVAPSRPIDERLEQHRPDDLPSRGPQGAEQRQLAAALGDQDREGVDDDVGAHDQRDAGEDQQERREEADPLEQPGRVLLGRVVTGQRLDLVGHHAASPAPPAPPG